MTAHGNNQKKQTGTTELENINHDVQNTIITLNLCSYFTKHSFSIQNEAQCLCFRKILTQKKINSLNGVKRLYFVRHTRCVDCEVWTKYLYIIQMNFRVQGVKTARLIPIKQRFFARRTLDTSACTVKQCDGTACCSRCVTVRTRVTWTVG
jgi:hypothetical protein